MRSQVTRGELWLAQPERLDEQHAVVARQPGHQVVLIGLQLGLPVGEADAQDMTVLEGHSCNDTASMGRAGRLLGVVPLIAPAAGVAYLSFHAGGFFPTAPALVAIVLAVALAARLAIAGNPLEGVSPLLVVATVAFGLFTVWTLWSGSWVCWRRRPRSRRSRPPCSADKA